MAAHPRSPTLGSASRASAKSSEASHALALIVCDNIQICLMPLYWPELVKIVIQLQIPGLGFPPAQVCAEAHENDFAFSLRWAADWNHWQEG
jgi:hypothetical protein